MSVPARSKIAALGHFHFPPAGAPGAADAIARRLCQVDDVLAAGPLFQSDRRADELLVDEVDQRGFVSILQLAWQPRHSRPEK